MKGFYIGPIKNVSDKPDLDIRKFVYDSEVIKNNVVARCKVLRGELPYNSTLGIPIGLDKDELDLTLKNIALSTYGVSAIKKFNSNIKLKKYSADIILETNYNEEIGVQI